MIPYSELREKLNSASPSEREVILAEFLERYDRKEEELDGRVIGFSVEEVLLHDDSIEATVNYVVVEGTRPDENGAYQDEDGESYDYLEKTVGFHLMISDGKTSWSGM